jgi:hypothetical protein
LPMYQCFSQKLSSRGVAPTDGIAVQYYVSCREMSDQDWTSFKRRS